MDMLKKIFPLSFSFADTVVNLVVGIVIYLVVPAVASVKKGDTVTAGQIIATAAEGKLSVNIHSSVNGKVKEVTDKFIWIEK